MQLSGEIQVTYAVFRRMALSYLGVRMLLARLLALAILLYAISVAVRERTPGFLVTPTLICFAILAAPEVIALVGWHRQGEELSKPSRYEFTATGVSVHTTAGSMHLPWTNVARVRRGRYAWSIRRADGLPPVVVPRAALTRADQRTLNEFFLAHPEFAG